MFRPSFVTRVLGVVFGVAGLLLVGGCAGSSPGTSANTLRQNSGTNVDRPSCGDLESMILERVRNGREGQSDPQIDRLMDQLSSTACPTEYQVVVDYVSASLIAKQYGPDPCEELNQYRLEPKAIELLRRDGHCTSGGGQQVAPESASGLSWDEARNHAGSVKRVCGPLAATGNSKETVFLDLGKAYPDQSRFTVVLWDVGPMNAPARGETVCATGTITLYEGVAQIQLQHPHRFEVLN